MTMAQVVDSVQAARQAASRHAWREAYDSYSTADPKSFAPEDLETFAEAAWWRGKLDEAISLRERAYGGHVAAGDKQAAARLALALSWDYSGRSAFAVSQGWFANAERLLDGQPESAEDGLMALTRAVNALFVGGNLSQALEDFGLAYELGERFGDRDTQVLALVGKGRALVKSGEVEQGLALIDEATAPRSAANCARIRRGSSTASRSVPARSSATTAVPPNGPRRRTGGVTGWTSTPFPERAVSTGRRSCVFALTCSEPRSKQ
jgi:tetratricopeptide (TPR) repeat protein